MSDENGLAEGEKGAIEERDKPVEAVVYFQSTSSFIAEIWGSWRAKASEPIVEHTYWIVITDPNFAGRVLVDSREDETRTLDIKFTKLMQRDLKGFKFIHFVGNCFRIRFYLDMESGKVIYQDLNI